MNDQDYKMMMRRKGDSFMGLLAGIALGVAAAMLTQEESRSKIRQAWKKMQNRGVDLLDQTSRKAEELTKTARQRTRRLAEKARSEAEEGGTTVTPTRGRGAGTTGTDEV